MSLNFKWYVLYGAMDIDPKLGIKSMENLSLSRGMSVMSSKKQPQTHLPLKYLNYQFLILKLNKGTIRYLDPFRLNVGRVDNRYKYNTLNFILIYKLHIY